MKKINLLLALCFSMIVFSTCQEEKITPLDKSGWVPDPVTSVAVKNLNGAAEISYDFTKHPDLLYVMAEFELNGKLRNTKATVSNKTLLVEGFGDTKAHEVKLYAVSRGEVRSTPYSVTVQPLKPQGTITFESLSVIPDFGGVYATYLNATKQDLGITIIHKDATGAWVTDNTLYTEKESGGLTARGLAPNPTVFGIYVQDRWGNYSDTLVTTLTPLFERLIPKPFKAVVLPTDNTTFYNSGNKMDKLWDGTVSSATIYYTAVNSGMPTWFTFDLGKVSKLSRFLYQQRNDVTLVQWGHGNPRYFEIWGSETAPNPDGSWTGWTKLMDVESVKPSGLPVGQNSDEDLALMYKGEEFNFPSGAPAVRYLRFKINETWNKTTFFHIGELTFWGQ